MKICLSAKPLTLTNIDENGKRIRDAMREARTGGAELILFGEASLSGFEALTFDYERDIRRCLGISGPELARLRDVARDIGIGVGVGFYENYKGGIYSTYAVIDAEGDIREIYRRVSPGWKREDACADYRDGDEFHAFRYGDKLFGLMICGDFWEEDLLPALIELDPVVDAFLWPVHCDYTVRKWQSGEADEYRARTAIMAKPVLFINNYVDAEDRAKGGLYHWCRGRTLDKLPMGETGLLYIDL